MGTTKRQRQKEGRQARIEAARAAEKRARTRRTARNMAIFVVALVGALFLYSRLTNDNNESSVDIGSASSTTVADGNPTTTASMPAVAITAPAAGASITGDTPCPKADGTSPRTTTFEQPPPTCIDPVKTYTAVVETSKGSFTIALDAKAAPLTVNNFVVLARYHYYDGVAFHRIIPDFVVQGGDATGDPPGTGGPGYTFADELPTDGPPYYQIGSVAMANSGANTNGSQFFVVTGQQGVDLPANYSRFGLVTDGIDVVHLIEAVGTEGGEPTESVTITAVTISES